MKLTDERVAKALGWKLKIIDNIRWRIHPNGSSETCRARALRASQAAKSKGRK